jgi:PAS domain S-box-containing protein
VKSRPSEPAPAPPLAPLRDPQDLSQAILAHIDEVVYIVRRTEDPLRGTVEYVSERAREITGFEPTAFRRDPELWFRLLHPEDVPAVQASTLAVLERGEGCTRVYRLRNGETGEYLWIEDRIAPILDAGGTLTGLVGAARDVSERKRAEETLEARARQQAAVAHLGQRALAGIAIEALMSETVTLVAGTLGVEYSVVLELQPGGRELVVRAMAGFEGLADRVVASEGGSPAGRALVSPGAVVIRDLRNETRFGVPPLLRRLGVVSGMTVAIEGEERPFGVLGAHSTRQRDFTPDDVHFLESMAHVLASAVLRKRHEVVRAQLLDRVISAQEDERRHLARELHDEVGQLLTGLKLRLETCDSGACAGGVAAVNDIIARVRELSMSLRPAMLDDLGLVPALLWLFERFSAQTQVRVAFQQAGSSRRFPRQAETAVFRIVQEALTNAARHAGVRELEVRLWADAERLGARIEDGGRGFDVAAALAGPTAGLGGMRERAEILGGQLRIESAAGSGTRVSVELPLAPEAGP